MSRRLIVAILAVGAALFVMLALLAHFHTPLPGDEAIISGIQVFDSPFIDSLLRGVSTLGETWPSVITVTIFAIIALIMRRFLAVIFIVAVPLVIELLNYGLKYIVDRPRPGGDLTSGGLSFPSGHATYGITFFGLLAFLVPRFIKNKVAARLVQGVMLFLIILGGTARVYVGKHWPSDIVGSFLFGGLLLLSAILIYKTVSKEEQGA